MSEPRVRRSGRRVVKERPDPRDLTVGPAFLLDTHVWLWWLEGHDALPRRVRAVLAKAQRSGRLHVSDFSVWELALKAGRGSLVLRVPLREWLARAREAPGIRYRGITAEDLLAANELPETPFRDPVDRALVAVARTSGLTIVTADRTIRAWARHGGVALLDAA